jgi:hypothetical protein
MSSQDEVTVPLTCITPLYGVVTDADEIRIGVDASLTRFSIEQLEFLGEDSRFTNHLKLYNPTCLLKRDFYLSTEKASLLTDEFQKLTKDPRPELDEDIVVVQTEDLPIFAQYVEEVNLLLRALQLYKPGRVVIGTSAFHIPSPFGVSSTFGCAEMQLDFEAAEHYRPLCEFSVDESNLFDMFVAPFYDLYADTITYPEVDLSIHRYCKETAEHGDVVDLMIALESLLVPEEDNIAFKLAQRVANLLGYDPGARKDLFKKVKDFYGLRSKIVHGAKTKKKDHELQLQVDELREITRKIILTVMTLAAKVGMGQDFTALLNDLCFDDDLRKSVQDKAAGIVRTYKNELEKELFEMEREKKQGRSPGTVLPFTGTPESE